MIFGSMLRETPVFAGVRLWFSNCVYRACDPALPGVASRVLCSLSPRHDSLKIY